jgi:hypothetical protein
MDINGGKEKEPVAEMWGNASLEGALGKEVGENSPVIQDSPPGDEDYATILSSSASVSP